MPAHTMKRPTFANLARTMRSQFALKLNECRLWQPIKRLFGQAYRIAKYNGY